MNVFLAAVRDAWRQSFASRWIQLLVGLGLLLALFFASLAFRPVPLADVCADRTKELADFRSAMPIAERVRFHETEHLVVDAKKPRTVAAEDDFPVGAEPLVVVDLAFRGVEQLDRVAQHWRDFVERRDVRGPAPASSPESAPIDREARRRFLEERYADFGFQPVYARPLGEGDDHWQVAVGDGLPGELVGGQDVTLFFGLATLHEEHMSRDQFLVTFEAGFAGIYSGFFGLLLLLGSFSSRLPDLLQKGRLELVLARPVGRMRLLLLEYAGAVLSVLAIWSTFFVACVVALGLKTGFWNFAFAGCSFTATAIFAVLFPVSLAVGVVLRNSIMAALASVGFYLLQSLVTAVKEDVLGVGGISVPHWLKQAADVLYWVVPKTDDLQRLNQVFLAKSRLSAAEYAHQIAPLVPKVDWGSSIGTSALFVVAMLAFASFVFSRRDW